MPSRDFTQMIVTTLIGVVLLCIFGLTYPSAINNIGNFLVSFISNGPAQQIAIWIDHVTAPAIIAPILFGLTCWITCTNLKKAVAFLGTTMLSYASVFLTKSLFAISRPHDAALRFNDFAFPSGHTTMAVFFALTFSYFLDTQNEASSHATTVLIWIIAAAIILSRLILEVHTLTDLLGGITLGFMWAQIFKTIAQAESC